MSAPLWTLTRGGYRTDAGRQRTLQDSHTPQVPNFSDFVRRDGHQASSREEEVRPQLASDSDYSCIEQHTRNQSAMIVQKSP